MRLSDFIELEESPYKNFLESKENHWEILDSLGEFIDHIFKNPPKGYTQKGDLLLGENVQLDESVKVVGRAVIGSRSTIGDGVLLRNDVFIGEDCNIGHGSEVKHSIILNKSRVAHLNYVGDSLVGQNVNLAAGVVLANFKNGSKNLEVTTETTEGKIKTGLQKLGALVGDGTAIGSNSVTDPGTIIGKNCLIYPLSLIRGTIEANKIVKNKPTLEIVDKE